MQKAIVALGALCAGLFGLHCVPAAALTPPINCNVAKSVIERAICDSSSFVALDREIAALYDRGLSDFSPGDRHELVESQLAFLQIRNRCIRDTYGTAHPGAELNECIRTSMERRVGVLRRVVDRGGF